MWYPKSMKMEYCGKKSQWYHFSLQNTLQRLRNIFSNSDIKMLHIASNDWKRSSSKHKRIYSFYKYVVASLLSLSLACATATLMHCSHSSAFFSSWALKTYVLLSVKISKARGRLRSRRFLATTLTLWTLLSSMGQSSGSSFWKSDGEGNSFISLQKNAHIK